jgi:hypothetical protein
VDGVPLGVRFLSLLCCRRWLCSLTVAAVHARAFPFAAALERPAGV